ncbi:type III pantothenate kinase [Candidatus Bipolaricaulota bacterium]|nr:type III pantothenate kinase [Candidatus Bipolaricaulota bacterium]
MLLVLDVGNTNIVFGLFKEDVLVHQWRVTTDRNRTDDELRLTTRSLLAEAQIDPSDITGVAIASVVPSLNLPLTAAFESLTQGEVGFLTADTSPIALDVEAPHTVGADRIANCIAAHTLYGGPILVLDFGTATTFDLVADDGRFLGGAIAPEMRLAARALTERAAQLHSVELKIPESVIGKNTATNIQAGVVLGYLDLVDGLIRRFRDEVGEPLQVIATGGKGEMFYQNLNSIPLYDPVLTLKGLRIWWSHNHNTMS